MRSSVIFDSTGESRVALWPDTVEEARMLALLDGKELAVRVDYEGHPTYHKVQRVMLTFKANAQESA